MSELQTKAAKPDDIKEIEALLRETWHATYDQVFGPETVDELCEHWHSIERLNQRLGNEQSLMLVARINGHLVATASASCDQYGKAVLKQLYVKPNQQGMGIGTQVLEHLLDLMPTYRSMELEVEPSNKGAIAFYERHGFTITGTLDDCGNTGHLVKALIMTRKN